MPASRELVAVVERVEDYRVSSSAVRKVTLRVRSASNTQRHNIDGHERGEGASADDERGRDEEDFLYEAGQWVDFIVPGMKEIGGFSLVSAPRECISKEVAMDLDQATLPYIDLAVKKSSHPVVAWIHSEKCHKNCQVRLRVGGEFTLRLLRDFQPNVYCFVAGGVGINPLYAMTLELTNRVHICHLSPPIICFFWSVKCMPDAYLLRNLLKLSRLCGFYFHIILFLTGVNSCYDLSNIDKSISDSHASTGRCTIEYSRITSQSFLFHMQRTAGTAFIGDEEKAAMFVCGPPAFTDDLLVMLSADCKIRKEKIFAERWW